MNFTSGIAFGSMIGAENSSQRGGQLVKHLQGLKAGFYIIIRAMSAGKPHIKRILVVDDDPAMTELLTLLLQPSGAFVITARDGLEGLELVREFTPDVVLMDLMMPRMDGWKTCKAIRGFSSVPIIILSALDEPGMVATALDAGADDYLVKPVTSGELMAHIQRLVSRKPGQAVLSTAAA